MQRSPGAMGRRDDFLEGSAAEFAAPLLESLERGDGDTGLPRQIGPYRIGRLIGRGGMAVVFEAHDLDGNRDVAIKALESALARVIGARRFLREIALMASLEHPNVLPILDSGELAGIPYLVMPLIRGGTLREHLLRDPLPSLTDAIAIVHQIAAALRHAHDRGIIHRDIKPENILLDERRGDTTTGEPNVLVTDFGLARFLDETFAERLSYSGAVMGTLPYMSPEQLRGERDIDARADIYALGCVLFELVAGRPLYAPREAAARLRDRHAHSDRIAGRLPPDAPARVRVVIGRALAEDPAGRFASVRELVSTLELTGTDP